MNKKILSISIILALNGCAIIPDLNQSGMAPIKSQIEQTNYTLYQKNSINQENWWLDFKDEQLNELIDKVQKNNSDIKIMKLNLEKSQQYSDILGSNNLPNVNLMGSTERELLSKTGMYPPPYGGSIINFNQIGLNVNYTLDYMDKSNLLLSEQYKKNESIKYQIENVELALNIQVIKSYLYYQYILIQEDFAQQKIDLNKEILNSYKNGLSLGKLTENDVNDIENQTIQLKTALNNINQNKNIILNSLIQLAGNKDIYIEKNDVLWNFINEIPLESINIEVIRNRPDVKYYFSNIEAQREHLEALKSDFYPSISLTGDVGFQKISFGDLLNKNSLFWNLGPSINLPIFDGGRIKTNYKIAGVDLNLFIENYNKTVFSAIQDVNNSILKEKTNYNNLNNEYLLFKNKNKNYQNTLNLYNNGKVSKIKKLESEMLIINAKEEKVNAEFNYINSKMDMIQSLGGK